MNSAMADGRRADGERRRQRVQSAIHRATQDGTTVSVSGIAQQAGVDRTFLYRHRDLLALIHAAALQPSASDPAAGPRPAWPRCRPTSPTHTPAIPGSSPRRGVWSAGYPS